MTPSGAGHPISRIKHLIDAERYLGYRMVWTRLRRQGAPAHRKAVQRIMQSREQAERRVGQKRIVERERSRGVAN